jgi:phage terminase small subunit
LTQDQKEAWRYAINHSPPGLLRSLDLSLLELWVVHLDLHRKAAAELFASESRLVERSGAAPMPNRNIGVMRNAALVLCRLAGEMGFSPASRSRVAATGGEVSVIPTDEKDKPPMSLELFLAKRPAVPSFPQRRPSRRQ